jgi:hypothetical protein
MTSSQDLPPSFSYHDLLKACALTGCPVCRIGAQSVKRYLDSLFYEYVNDPGTRDRLVNSLGFCSEHIRLLLSTRIADGLGASIIYEHIIKTILRDFPDHSHKAAGVFPLRSMERARMIRKFVSASAGLGKCAACEQRAAASDRALYEMNKSLGEKKLRLALQESDGLCLPHLAQLLESTLEADNISYLLDLTENKLKSRQSEMAELIRKNNYQFQSEGITQDEALAWRKAMCMISGASITLTGEKHE